MFCFFRQVITSSVSMKACTAKPMTIAVRISACGNGST